MASLGKHVKRMSARVATSAAPAATVTPPSLAAASRAAPLVSCTTSRTPAFARLLAMGRPMVPSPMNPTVSFMRTPPESVSRRAPSAAERLAGATIGGLDVRAVGLDEILRGYLLPQRVDLLGEGLAKAEIVYLLGQPGEGLEQPDAHGAVADRGLADLIEGAPREAGEAQGRPDNTDGAPGADAGADVIREGGERAQLVAEPVYAGEASEGVVHGGAEGAEGNLHELRDAEFHVLLEGALAPDLHLTLDGGGHRCRGVGRKHVGEGSALHHELTGPVEKLHGRVGSLRRGEQTMEAHDMDEAREGRPYHRSVLRETWKQAFTFGRSRPWQQSDAPGFLHPLVQRLVEVAHDVRDHVLRLDGHGDAMAEDHDEDEARDDEGDVAHERELGHEDALALLPRHHEAQENVHEASEEEPDGELGHPVAHEAVENARPEVDHGHREYEEGHGEDEGQHRADRAQHRPQDGAGIVGAAHGDPSGQADDSARGLAVHRHGDDEEHHGGETHDEGHSPQVGSKLQNVTVVLAARHGGDGDSPPRSVLFGHVLVRVVGLAVIAALLPLRQLDLRLRGRLVVDAVEEVGDDVQPRPPLVVGPD